MEYHLLTEKDKEIISSWKYEGEYAIYNLDSYKEQKQEKRGLANPKRTKNYFGFIDKNQIVGFTNILEEEHEVFVGIGVNPLLCGKGYGKEILELTTRISKELYPNKPLYLEVRTWNTRAIACYLKAGFVQDGTTFIQTTVIGKGEFVRLVKK